MKYYRPGPDFMDRSEHNSGRSAHVKCSDQWWTHLSGTKMLVVNPVFIPRLSQILQNASTTDAVDPSTGVFQPRERRHFSDECDTFRHLPREVLYLIIADLTPKDVANFQLVFCQFEQLPQSFFYHLLLKDMPWLREMWTEALCLGN